MSRKLTKEEWVERANEKHGGKFNYDKADYINSKTKIIITCPIHGDFEQLANAHLQGQGCPTCSKFVKTKNIHKIERCKIKYSKNDFLESLERKGIKTNLDFTKSIYVNSKEKMLVTCPIHGDFYIRPNDLLNGHGCKECSKRIRINKRRDTFEDFVNKANLKHNNKYKYEEIQEDYSKVIAICPKHGKFIINKHNHLNGNGCKKCFEEKRKLNNLKWDTEKFINQSKMIHGDKYDYSKTEYKSFDYPLTIICPKHGEFWQTPHYHLQGCGCPKCKSSKLETEVRNFLENLKIYYIEQAKFDWLGRQSLDFYLPNYNTAIECQGIQHFKPTFFFGSLFGDEKFKKILELDDKKNKLCEENGVKLKYYTNLNLDYRYEIYTDLDKLIKDILSDEKDIC